MRTKVTKKRPLNSRHFGLAIFASAQVLTVVKTLEYGQKIFFYAFQDKVFFIEFVVAMFAKPQEPVL